MSQPHCKGCSISCQDCRMSALCMPLAIHAGELERLDNIIQRGKPLQKKQHIFYAGDKFRSVFAVRSGSIKSYCVSDDGKEQVTGFYLPGEIFGWDGIAHQQHSNTAIAMETSSVCEIPFERLEELSLAIPSLQRHFMQLMSKEITSDQRLITLLSKNSAEQRIAALLLSLSDRLHRQRLSATQFRLPMSRADMGNYLGLTVETVSRVFSRFQTTGLIEADKKELQILNLKALRDLANGEETD